MASSVSLGEVCMMLMTWGFSPAKTRATSSSFWSSRPKPVSSPSLRRSTEMPTQTGSPVASAASVAQTE